MDPLVSSAAEPHLDIAFDCLPLRTVSRLDVPLDASDAFRRRAEKMKAAIVAWGADRSYFLYNAHCIFRFAHSEVDGVCRFAFEGAVRTDAGDRKCEQTMLDVNLVSETCDGVPPVVEAWLAERVRQAVAIEFDRFIAAQLALPREDAGVPTGLDEISALRGMGV
jgi:hypothetical protein